MAVDLQVQLFDAFLGEQQGIHSVILPDIFSSGGSKNLWIDKYGRAKKIAGYAKVNSSAVTSHTGGNAMLTRSLFHYKQTTGGTTTIRELGVFDDGTVHWDINYSSNGGVSWNFLYDGGSSSNGRIPDFSQYGNDVYITNGAIAPRKVTGTSISAAGATQSPTPTATASASAGNLLGTYTYKLVSMVSGVRQIGSASSAAVAVQNAQITLAWTQDANASVTGYEVYRTSGTGSVFYFVAYVDGRGTVAYTDNIDDLTILQNRVMQEHGDPPPTGAYFCEPHKQRIWWFRTDTFPQRGWFSDPGLPDSVLTTSNFIDFADSETIGDVLTGAIGNFEGQLIVFSERAVWAISGTGQVIGNILDWTRIRTNAEIGAVSHRAVARIPGGSKYTDQNGKIQSTSQVTLAYLSPLGDIRLFDGDNDLIISYPQKTTLSTINYAQRAKSHCLHDPSHSEVTWFFATGSSGEPNMAVTWNYAFGVWYEREWPFACALLADSSSTAAVILSGSNNTTTGGYVYQLWSGNSFDGASFKAQWMTKTLYGVNDQSQPATSNLKRFRWADFGFETEQTVTLTVEWLQGNTPDNAAAFGTTTIAPMAAHIFTANGDRLTTADGDPITVSQASTTARAILKNTTGDYLHDIGVRMRVYDNAANGSWSLEYMQLAYQILIGLQRRMQG